MKSSPFKNHRAFSLIEVIVAMGIIAIGFFAMMSMMSTQQKESKSLSETMAKLDFEKNFIKTMADSTVCQKMLVTDTTSAGLTSVDVTFDNASTTPFELTLKKIPLSTLPGSPLLAQENELVSPVSNTLKVKNILFKILDPVGTDRYQAKFVVNYKGGIREIRPTETAPFLISTTTTGTTTKITSCSATGATVAAADCSPGSPNVSYDCLRCSLVGGILTPAGKCHRTLGSRTGTSWELASLLGGWGREPAGEDITVPASGGGNCVDGYCDPGTPAYNFTVQNLAKAICKNAGGNKNYSVVGYSTEIHHTSCGGSYGVYVSENGINLTWGNYYPCNQDKQFLNSITCEVF